MKKILIITGVIILVVGAGFLYFNFFNARTLYHGSVRVVSGDIVAANESQRGNSGFGPRGFVISAGRLLADKDIPGFPREEKYKEAVRKDITNINYVTHLEIDENSWVIEARYPWNAVY